MFLQFFIWLTDGEGGRGGRESERERRRIEGGKKRNRGHWSSSTMHHAQQQRVGYRVGGKGSLGSPMLSKVRMYIHWQQNTINRVDRRRSRLIEHPQCVASSSQMWLYDSFNGGIRLRGWEGSRLYHGNTVWPRQSPSSLHTYINNWVVVKGESLQHDGESQWGKLS